MPRARLLAVCLYAVLCGFWGGTAWRNATAEKVPPGAALAQMDPAYALIEPAEGEATPAAKEGEPKAEGAEEGKVEGEGKAEGGEGASHKPEPKKAANGKVVSGDPDLPNVSIGGQTIITSRMQFDRELATATPAALQNPDDTETLRRRLRITPYSHNPTMGPQDAAVTILEMTDLSCVACSKALAAVDKVMDANAGKVRLINLHNPVNQFNDVNLPAFYGKVAQRGGLFWQYRKAVEGLTNPTPDSYFETLISVGMDRMQARRLLTTEARRFYRELDADATLCKQIGVGNPPHLYVNGIHLGENGISIDKLPDVMAYELKRPADNFGYFK